MFQVEKSDSANTETIFKAGSFSKNKLDILQWSSTTKDTVLDGAYPIKDLAFKSQLIQNNAVHKKKNFAAAFVYVQPQISNRGRLIP